MIFPKPFVTILGKTYYLHQTPDEREEARRAAQERRMRANLLKQQRKEVKYLAKAIPVWLAKMGHAYWYKKSEKEPMQGHFNPVKINAVQITTDAYFFRVETKRLPRGVMIAHLKDPNVVETLSHAAGSAVRVHEIDTGFWYSVDTAYGLGNIPMLVGYSEMINDMPPESPPLAFPLGKGENGRSHYGDMAQMINLLIGGTKGGGKSNAANVMLCTLISRNKPHQLRLFLTDLKGGIEFADYTGIPHLGGDVFYVERGEGKNKRLVTLPKTHRPAEGEQLQPPLGQQICVEPADVLPMLAYVEAELDRRTKILAGKAKKIDTFNRRYPDKAMSYWLVVIDELATLMEDGRYKKQAAMSLSEIARKGRAVGIFVVLATQTPTSAIVPGQISNNMDSRLAFRCGNGVASGILLGSGEYDAEKLPTVPGRFIWKWGGEKLTMQAPLIEDTTIKRVIAQARAGHASDPREIELAQKAKFIFEFALDKLHGECQTNYLYSMIKDHGIKQAEVKSILAKYEYRLAENGPEILLGDEIYYLAPPINSKRIARWLVKAADFLDRKHPNPDYNFELACRVSQVEISTEPFIADPPNPPDPPAQGAFDPYADLPFTPLHLLPHSPNGNGSIADEAIAQELESEWFDEKWENEAAELEAV